MAGESPDRSEQRKSSGTAPEERDPRLAVLRGPAASASSGSGTGSTDAAADVPADTPADTATADTAAADTPADTATAVFRSPSDEELDEERAGSGSDAEGAAGVADADGSEPEDGAEGSEGGSTARDAGSGTRGGADAGEAAGAAEADAAARPADAGEAGGTADASETDGGDRAAVPRTRAESGRVGSDDRDQPADGGSESEPAKPDGPDDARLRAAVAAWVSNADDQDAEAHADAAGGEPADERPGTGGVSDAPHVPGTRDSGATAPGQREARSDGAGKDRAAANVDPAGDKEEVDHPTAVFKAPRPPRVDQPTTALKLPPVAPKPDAPSERTSKFVPLRSDDVRPAAVIGPTVTPDVTPKPGYNPGRPSTTGWPGATGPAGTTRPGSAGPGPDGPGSAPTGRAWNATPTAPGLTEAERTRQQPMPPKPPLDLLAELTNTPPPRQTPVRTLVRRVKIWTPLLLLIVIIFAIAQAVRPLPEPVLVLSADPTYTFGGGDLEMPWPAEGQGAVEVEGVGTVGTYGQEKSAPIASMAKVMTAYVILKEHPITGKQTGERIEVDKKAGEEADRPDESTAPIEEGQKYTERQMLQLLMIPSGNNVARLLARWDATTEDVFVEKMNAAAKDLGMTKSTYTDPSGLKSTTVSTPADQLKLAKAVMQNDVFRKIVNMPQADIPGIGKTIYNNNNILLEPGVSGIKTGSSTPAGGNLLWAADTIIDGKSRRIIGVVMGADTEGTLDDKLERARRNSLKLIQAAQKGVDSAVVVKKGQVVGYVDDGLGGKTPVVSTKDLKAIGWGGLRVKLDIDAGAQSPAHAAKSGTVVGSVTVGTGTGLVSAPVALQSEMTEPTFGEKLTRIS